MRNNTTILLVDHDAETYYRQLVAAVRDCQVTVAKSKQKACEFFFRNDVNLVLLDHTPDDPCTELLKVLKFVAPWIPAIVMTAYGSEEIAVTMFRIGANDYIKKPLNINELSLRIEVALGREISSKKIFNQTIKGIDKAIQYINANYCLPLKLNNVAREAGMSASCLTRAFKKTLSISFTMYVNKVRIARAIQMIERDGELTLCEIAFACGFTNQYYFSRTFKRLAKSTPSDLKKAIAADKQLKVKNWGQA